MDPRELDHLAPELTRARFGKPCLGYVPIMDPHPHQAEADESDPDKQSTPAGFAPDLEDRAEEIGASTDEAPPEP